MSLPFGIICAVAMAVVIFVCCMNNKPRDPDAVESMF